MGSTLITVLYDFLHLIISQFLGPIFSAIDSLIVSLGLSNYIYLFQGILDNYIAPAVGFFFEFMGPHTISIILLEFSVTIIYYGIVMTTTWILKIFNLIKKLPLA